MKKQAGLIILLSLPLMQVGCRSAMNSTERENPKANPNVVEDQRIKSDTTLGQKIAIVQVNEDVVSGDMMRIQVVLQNKKSKSVNVNYAFEWFDQSGMLLNKITMKPILLSGGEKKAISGVASTPNAVDFSLKLQEPRPFSKRVTSPFSQ